MMTLTERECEALKWWIGWTKEDLQRTVDYTKEMERGGEVEKGAYDAMTKNFDLITELNTRILLTLEE